jgi:hypothetical protein
MSTTRRSTLSAANGALIEALTLAADDDGVTSNDIRNGYDALAIQRGGNFGLVDAVTVLQQRTGMAGLRCLAVARRIFAFSATLVEYPDIATYSDGVIGDKQKAEMLYTAIAQAPLAAPSDKPNTYMEAPFPVAEFRQLLVTATST